jgi:hypothetical protein
MLERIYALTERLAVGTTDPSPDWRALAEVADELARLMRASAEDDSAA